MPSTFIKIPVSCLHFCMYLILYVFTFIQFDGNKIAYLVLIKAMSITAFFPIKTAIENTVRTKYFLTS